MAPDYDTDQLVGAAEIAERLGLKQAATVHDWRARYSDFPEPVMRLRMGLVWFWPDVETWALANEKPGRRR